MSIADRERAQRAEARVMELEAELAEYRAAERRAKAGPDWEVTYHALLRVKAQYARNWRPGITGPARLLTLMLDHPGQRFTRGELHDLISNDETWLKVVDVVLSQTRRLLALIGIEDPFDTLWGQGWTIFPDKAAEIRAALGLDL